MPPPTDHSAFHLQVLPESFYVIQLHVDHIVPDTFLLSLCKEKGFISLTRTDDEISIVTESRFDVFPSSIGRRSQWMCIKIRGPMEHDLTGVMANFAAPLKEAQVPIFALSTWNTDYVLVPIGMIADAKAALLKDGWEFVD